MAKSEIGIHFSIMAESLEKQFIKQGYTLGDHAGKMQELNNAVMGVYMAGLITEADKNKICDRFMKKLLKYVKPLKK